MMPWLYSLHSSFSVFPLSAFCLSYKLTTSNLSSFYDRTGFGEHRKGILLSLQLYGIYLHGLIKSKPNLSSLCMALLTTQITTQIYICIYVCNVLFLISHNLCIFICKENALGFKVNKGITIILPVIRVTHLKNYHSPLQHTKCVSQQSLVFVVWSSRKCQLK